ncbi:efflux RND transporter periplasmic adaptor subunit [Sneathiella sp. P13V-1]|uniref:efflux RND transporter periplasmic adaptor subunit n=1 Tax=Sneathiella sp. P13V-1 TaxID=2697366 RepID=UPI00187B1EFA|nr:efflux RND transporter periplasmic adaptor subunit [Sneathiella sp. P13V-1]MBE7635880.1 efflux RND transporter periplasmic adaptor subunit [Sneathiella sp. P13V-1]
MSRRVSTKLALKSLLLLPLVVLLSACLEDGDKEAEVKPNIIRPAKIIEVGAGSGILTKVFPGITEASRKSELAFRVSGPINDLPVRAGQELKQGDLIARLDDARYQNVLADRKATYDLTRIELERRQQLQKKNHVSKSTLDIARTNFEGAKAALKQARDDLQYTRLVAPYDGIVSRILVENFENVQAKQTIVLFQGNQNIDVAFNVPEDLLVRVNEGNTNGGLVHVKFDSVPDQVFEAYYKEHETLPDASTRSFRVVVSMPIPTGLTALPGMSVNVIVDVSQIIGEQKNDLSVPVEAVFEKDGGTWVWLVKSDNTVTKTRVAVKRIEGDQLLISQGLIEGNRVIAAGVDYLREGQTVRALPKERGL